MSFKSPPQEGQTSGLPLPIAQAVEKLQKGKVTEPIEIQGKWWLVKLDDVRPVKVPPFEQARQDIYNMLSAQEMERATSAAGPAAQPGRHDHPLVGILGYKTNPILTAEDAEAQRPAEELSGFSSLVNAPRSLSEPSQELAVDRRAPGSFTRSSITNGIPLRVLCASASSAVHH